MKEKLRVVARGRRKAAPTRATDKGHHSTVGAMSAADLREWIERHELTMPLAAESLGLKPRVLFYYLNGRAIPRVVELLCDAYDQGYKGPD